MQAATLRLATEDAHRQQQILQRRDRAQQVVGHDPHVAADAADRVQQGQRVQGTGGMVGDDQQAAGGRDLRQCGRVHLVLAVDEFQAGGDEAESAQACAALQEGFDLVQPRPAADAAQQRPRQLATAAMEPIGEALLKALFEFLHGGSIHARRPVWPTACARQAAAMWRFRGRTMTADRVSQAARSGPSGPRPVVTLVEHWAPRLGPNPAGTAPGGPTRP
ncbi:hypothetical protein G6F65_013879 [Rhizopus arrhizus]|nr:hypothetical protein G6F65_013879 [Rhizopus arrhizus]